MEEQDESVSKHELNSSNLGILGQFFTDSSRNGQDWTMKCRLCSSKIKSKSGVTSNFHRHLRVNILFFFLLSNGYRCNSITLMRLPALPPNHGNTNTILPCWHCSRTVFRRSAFTVFFCYNIITDIKD